MRSSSISMRNSASSGVLVLALLMASSSRVSTDGVEDDELVAAKLEDDASAEAVAAQLALCKAGGCVGLGVVLET